MGIKIQFQSTEPCLMTVAGDQEAIDRELGQEDDSVDLQKEHHSWVV